MTQAKNTICLWYDKDALAAANFYAATFPDSEGTGRCAFQVLSLVHEAFPKGR